MACPSYFIVHSPRTCDAPTYTKLEWLVHRILSFTLRAHATLRRIHQLPTSVGLAQARPNYYSDGHETDIMYTPCETRDLIVFQRLNWV